MFSTESATLNLDTYKVVKLLQDKGYSEQEAEGFIEAIQEITLNGVATKEDLRQSEKRLNERIDSVRDGLKEDISNISINVKDTIISLQKTMMATVLGGVGLTVALIKLIG